MRHHANLSEKGRVKKRWVDLVESVLALYNQSPHRSLRNHSPLFASKPENWNIIFENHQEQLKNVGEKRRARLRLGTLVRVRLKGGTFGLRASDQKNSEEVFSVRRHYLSQPIFQIISYN